MNIKLLHKPVQDFIKTHYKEDISKIILQGSPFPGISIQELATQLVGKKIAEKKLPLWFAAEGILYPPKLNLEQTSSQITAEHKASLIHGETIADLTGGFGVDSVFFAKTFKKAIHCEWNPKLSEQVSHNTKILNIDNLQCISGDGLGFLKATTAHFDWLYLDPSRRNESGNRVFRLSDCTPKVAENLSFLFRKTSRILLKISPFLDLQAGILELKNIKEIHIVAVKNEVKEVLYLLEKDFLEKIQIKTINFGSKTNQIYENTWANTSEKINFGTPLHYLYEPNAALMKSGLFVELAQDFKLQKLHPNTHLFTADQLKKFPGRRFQIIKALAYNKKKLKKELDFGKANISTRNFHESVVNLKKIFKLKDGGNKYLFFTQTGDNQRIVLLCNRV